MHRARLSAILCLVSLSSLWSAGLDWGIKYGMGFSSLQGADKYYELRYNIYEHSASSTALHYLRLRAEEDKGGLAQNTGVYTSSMLTRKGDSVSLHTELLWQRYAFSHRFQDAPLSSDDGHLSSVFADVFEGRIERTVDYLTLPVLISLNQEIIEEERHENHDAAFIYLGPPWR